MISMYTLIVSLIGIYTTLPGPTVQGPLIIDTNLVLMPREVIVLMATCNAAPDALFSLFSLGT